MCTRFSALHYSINSAWLRIPFCDRFSAEGDVQMGNTRGFWSRAGDFLAQSRRFLEQSRRFLEQSRGLLERFSRLESQCRHMGLSKRQNLSPKVSSSSILGNSGNQNRVLCRKIWRRALQGRSGHIIFPVAMLGHS